MRIFGWSSLILIFLFSCTESSSHEGVSANCANSKGPSNSMNLDGGVERPADGSVFSAPIYLLEIKVGESTVDSTVSRCTGTAVSSSTIITAAHCVAEKGSGRTRFGNGSLRELGVEICASIDDNDTPEFCTALVYYSSKWQDTNEPTDLAWIGFPVGTFKDFYEMARDPLSVGQNLLAVGYGPGSFGGQPLRRYGLTQAKSPAGGVFSSSQGNNATFERVELVPGDSGGPVLNHCKIAGIAAKSTDDAHNLYVDIYANRDFLKSASGKVDNQKNAYVHFCGLSVVYDDSVGKLLCPTQGLNGSTFSIDQARDHFPCGRQIHASGQTGESSELKSPADGGVQSEGTCPNQM